MINDKVRQVARDSQKMIGHLSSQSPTHGSITWYAINNLQSFKERIVGSKTKQEVLNAGKILSRFSVDSLEWGSELFKNFTRLSEACRKSMWAVSESGGQKLGSDIDEGVNEV